MYIWIFTYTNICKKEETIEITIKFCKFTPYFFLSNFVIKIYCNFPTKFSFESFYYETESNKTNFIYVME